MNRYKDLMADAAARNRAQGPSRAELILGGIQNPTRQPSTASGAPGALALGVLEDGQEKKKNKLELAYSRLLEVEQQAGEIHRWWWDALALKLGHDCRYNTDFLVQRPSGLLEIHETKGFMRDDALVKLKVCAAMYPFTVVLVKREKGTWIRTPIKAW